MFGILSPIFLKDDLPRHLRWVRVTWHTHDKELRRFGRRRRQEAAEEARGYVLAAADGDACEKLNPRRIEMLNIYRSGDEKVIAGVCAGIARRLDGGALRAGMTCETGETGGTGVGTLGTGATFARRARRSGLPGHPVASPARHTSLARHPSKTGETP